MKRNPIDPPHLTSHVAVLELLHPDLNNQTVDVDVLVQRFAGEDEPFIYIEERGEGPMMRLRVEDAPKLIEALTTAIAAAEVQATVVLPQEATA